jgi:hypothetical protein
MKFVETELAPIATGKFSWLGLKEIRREQNL